MRLDGPRLSGWCGVHGRPDHAGCRVPTICACPCHQTKGAAR